MQPNDLKRLKVAAHQFYLDMYQDQPTMPDCEYDELAKQYEAETGKSVKTLIDWESIDKLEHIQDLSSLTKIQVGDNNLRKAAEKWLKDVGAKEYYINLKLDGCGLRAYYKDKKLCKVLSTPDEKFGQLKTDSLGMLFPQEIDDPTVESICGELVVDPKEFGFKARSKANGLVNSKFKEDEIKKYAMVRVYRVTYTDDKEYNFDRQIKTLSSLPELRDNEKCYFKTATSFGLDDIPTSAITNITGEWMLADGIVIYSDKGMKACKFYYTEEVETEVTNITYRKMKTGKWYPTVLFKPVIIEENCISKAAGGSLDIIKSRGIGIGAKITVIRSNGTIPKILNVLEKSDKFNIPEE